MQSARKQNTANVGLTYTYGPYTAAYSYLTRQNQRLDAINGGNPVSGRQDANRFEASYNANNLYVAVGYQKPRATAATSGRLPLTGPVPTRYLRTPRTSTRPRSRTHRAVHHRQLDAGHLLRPRLEHEEKTAKRWTTPATTCSSSAPTTPSKAQRRRSYACVKYDRAIDVAGTERESTVGPGISHSF